MSAKENNNNGKYDDIINLPRFISDKRAKMSLHDRAAQFSPFAALTGYEDEVIEVARITERRVELCDETKGEIDRTLHTLGAIIDTTPSVSVTYFLPDDRKHGGKYNTVHARLIDIDYNKGTISLSSGEVIFISTISTLVPYMFEDMFE